MLRMYKNRQEMYSRHVDTYMVFEVSAMLLANRSIF